MSDETESDAVQGPVPLDVSSLSAQRILVVAPHPDDEALGCGGLITLLRKLGRQVHVVFVTDGGASHTGSTTWPRHRLTAQRKREAEASLEALGLGDQGRTFLALSDAAMPSLSSPDGQTALATLTMVVETFAPDLVLLPWRRDPHCDHRDAWTLTQAVLAAMRSQPSTLEYAVWLDEIGASGDHPRAGEAERIAFDISDAVDTKRAAVMAHVSQTTALIADDPDAFRLSEETIRRLTGRTEFYWRPLASTPSP